MKTLRWNSNDLEAMPDDGKRYEIVDGELYVSTQPHMHHQIVCGNIFALLDQWSNQTHSGMAIFTPGVIFTNDNAVVPDVVCISYFVYNSNELYNLFYDRRLDREQTFSGTSFAYNCSAISIRFPMKKASGWQRCP